MKFAIIIPDGCADEPQASLGGRTPLQAAQTPAMDAIATAGIVGRANNVPAGFTPGSDVANMSLLGYDVKKSFAGRAPIEAAAQGIELGPDDWAVRCNLVTVQGQIMRDFTAGHISTEEGTRLLADVQASLAPTDADLRFVPGVSYRNLLLVRGTGVHPPFSRWTQTIPPHDLTDQSVIDAIPRGEGADLLHDLMVHSGRVFENHPVNTARIKANKSPATHVWLWGLGRTPVLRSFRELHQIQGAMITAVDLLRGLAKLIGWNCIEVPGATGYLDTDYVAKGRYACQALADTDLICVHVEATDEASHEGRVDAKIEALERIDRDIVAPVHAELRKYGDYRILVSPDHPTFLRTKTHSHGYVPWTLCGKGIEPDREASYDEVAAGRGAHCFDEGHRLMAYYLGKEEKAVPFIPNPSPPRTGAMGEESRNA
jgi:2,3-bisphosphoglycerate-independent phosphoglycerate mutase